MCDAHREACFSQKNFTNELNMVLPLRAWVEKTVYIEWKHTDSLTNNRFQVLWLVNKAHIDSLLRHGYNILQQI